MLASPLLPSPMFSPQHTSEDYRPSKDTEAFSSRLPPPVEFIEGSSSGTLAVVEGKYEVINASPKLSKAEVRLLVFVPTMSVPHYRIAA
jgi:ubiquitin carboxyl-terminal hydrolase 36/42